MDPLNLTAQLHHRAAGNPPSTLPDSAISNCFPGLEFDFRNIWRRLLEGIELHEASGLVVHADPEHDALGLVGRLLVRVADSETLMVARSPGEPDGLSFMEWSNALADVVADRTGELVPCVFASSEDLDDRLTVDLRVRRLFVRSDAVDASTALIDEAIAQPGELTQSLCSPWQNDYVECACYYWAASRPDYVDVEFTPAGSTGEPWLAVTRETYAQLFQDWQSRLRFIVGGRHHDPPD